MKDKTYPVAEIFGPTVQGEGVDQGRPCYFVRMGGCDFKCEWCDTPHAVLPERVRHLPRMSDADILKNLDTLSPGPEWVVISGGNPALHDLSSLVQKIHARGMKVSVETQGTRFKEWLTEVDRLCVSPKPPSSQMVFNATQFFNEFMGQVLGERTLGDVREGVFVKVVVFDHMDYIFAKNLRYELKRDFETAGLKFYLSAGNDAGRTVGNPTRVDERTVAQVRNDLADKLRWLTNRVMVDKDMSDVIVQAQQHVICWGNELGR